VYWHGTPEEFFKLHDFAVAAIRRALPTARVGGPEVAGAGGEFMEKFLAHCAGGVNYATGARGTPTDFLSFHAKGQPGYADGHVRLGIAPQLEGIDRGFALIASVPAFKGKPVVIGECDPDGCAACVGPQLGYRPGSLYASYTAASFARINDLARRRGVNVEGALTWAFEFEDQPYFAGQRVLATNGIDLPVLNVFRMLNRLGGRQVAADSPAEVGLDEIMRRGVRAAPDVGILASREGRRVGVLVWHYHDDDLPGPAAQVRLELAGLPVGDRSVPFSHYRVDDEHGNAYQAWRALGSPPAPTDDQYAQMRAAAADLLLKDGAPTVECHGGRAVVDFPLPRQAVSLLVFDL
jgi:xylan 1,4-beta-xylosidase